MRARVLLTLGLVPAWLALVAITGGLEGHLDHDAWKPVNSSLTLAMVTYVLVVLGIWLLVGIRALRRRGR
jgi:hypothetical protein